MPKQQDFTLTDEQAKTLAKVIQQDKRATVVRRATTVHLLHLSHRVADVTEIVSASRPIIDAWRRRFLAQSVEGLANRRTPGGRRKVSAAYRTAREEAVARPPAHHGYEFAIWTCERSCLHVNTTSSVVAGRTTVKACCQEPLNNWCRNRLLATSGAGCTETGMLFKQLKLTDNASNNPNPITYLMGPSSYPYIYIRCIIQSRICTCQDGEF